MSLFEGRGYQLGKDILPSVTTVCDVLRKMGLEVWLGNTPKADRDKQTERGKRIGSAIHANFDAMFKGVGVNLETLEEELRPPLLAGIKFVMEKSPKTVASELVVASQKYKYAGTLDRVVIMPDGKKYVLDFKTTNKSKYSGTGIYPENFIQTAAYKEAYQEMFDDPIDGTLIVRLDKDNPKGEYEIAIDKDPAKSFKAFLSALELFNYLHPDFYEKTKPHVILCSECYTAYRPQDTHQCLKEATSNETPATTTDGVRASRNG